MKQDDKILFAQLEQIAEGLAATFAPFCEVVLHDLRDPQHAILAIHNNLSDRAIGEPATELGLARIADPAFPQVIANYSNSFSDGRRAKSTSIGIKDNQGRYVAALCLNVDLTLFNSVQSAMAEFTTVDARQPPLETLNRTNAEALRAAIDQFAARKAKTPRSLRAGERKALLRELKEAGFMNVRHATETVSAYLGVSRSTVYTDSRETSPTPQDADP